MHYYKFNIPDWNLGTNHLSLIEEAIYFRLLNHYYDTETPIPLETQSVFRRLRMGNESDIAASILQEFFVKTEKGYVHGRCEKILKEYKKNNRKNAENGAKGGRPRKDAACSETQEKPTGLFSETEQEPKDNPNQEPLTINQELETSINNTSAQAPSGQMENPEPVEPKKPKKSKADYPDWFESIWLTYPPRLGGNSKSDAFKTCNARIKEGYTTDQLEAAAHRYRVFILATGKLNTEYVKQASTFFGPGGHIDNEWRVPSGQDRQPYANSNSGGHRPFAEVVGQQARGIIERLHGNSGDGNSGFGAVRQDERIISEQGKIGRPDPLC